MEMNNVIKAVGLTKIFRTESVQTTALNEVNLEIYPGEFVAIMGPSGCGKSTLLNVMGLLDNPTSGELWFMGQEVSRWKENDRTDLRNGNLGFVFQSFNLIDELTVFENVELPLLYAGVPVRERVERVNRALDRMQITHRSEHYPQQLSGGQQQRVAIARAIVTNPKIILATGGTLRGLFSPIPMGDIMQNLNWRVQWGFVFKKTIPFFWFPAHTITFLLPGEMRVLFAALLGVALGVILAVAARKK